MPVNVPFPQSMRRSTSHNYNTPRYHGPSSPKIDLLPADSRASDSQDMQGQSCWTLICVTFCAEVSITLPPDKSDLRQVQGRSSWI